MNGMNVCVFKLALHLISFSTESTVCAGFNCIEIYCININRFLHTWYNSPLRRATLAGKKEKKSITLYLSG